MSSDKNSTVNTNIKSSNDPSSTIGYINPNNIDYSIIKNYYPSQSYPSQTYMNYPQVDLNFQQNQNYPANNQAYTNGILYII